VILRLVEDGAKGSVDVGRDGLVSVESQVGASVDVDERSILTLYEPSFSQLLQRVGVLIHDFEYTSRNR
jgi:hypothetical protein